MRPLIIICSPAVVPAVQAEILQHAHWQLGPRMTAVIPFDVESDWLAGQQLILEQLGVRRPYAMDKPLVLGERGIGERVRLNNLGKASGFDVVIASHDALMWAHGNTSAVHKQIKACGLSVMTGATAVLSHWAHGEVSAKGVSEWLDQFQRLGAYGWIGKALLAQMDLMLPATLSDCLGGLRIEPDEALCVNRDPRGNWKSADVLGNQLGKRFGDRKIYSYPAEAIQNDGAKRIVLVEDGLWSGTEAIGILQSLMGEREDTRLKTMRLNDPKLLAQTQVRLAYVSSTDYGQAIVRRELEARGLGHITLESNSLLRVAKSDFLAQLGDQKYDISKVLNVGPSANDMEPYAFATLTEHGLDPLKAKQMKSFCGEVGYQLLGHYLDGMRTSHGWGSWAVEKQKNAATGMHGLGLTHAFGHSIPKASLPLYWGAGEVTYNGKRVIWRPLLPNS